MNLVLFYSSLKYIGFFIFFIVGYLLTDKLIKARYIQQTQFYKKTIFQIILLIIKLMPLYIKLINHSKKKICDGIYRLIMLLLETKLKGISVLEQGEIVNKIKNNILELDKTNLDESEELHKNEVLKDSTLQYLISKYFILKDAIYRNFKDYNDEYYEFAKIYQNDIQRIYSIREFWKIKKAIDKVNAKINDDYRKLIEQIVSDEKNNKYGKIKIEFSTINELIKIVPILLLLGGFLYNYFLFQTLGIKISDYFTISDYVQSSLDVIVPLLWVTGFQATVTLMAYYNRLDKIIKNDLFQISYTENDKKIAKIIYFSIILVILLQITLYYKYQTISYPLLQTITLFIAYMLLERFFPFQRIDNPYKIYMFAMIGIFFTIALAYHIIEEIDKVTTNKVQKSLYTFSTKSDFDLSSYHFIKSTSTYSFFYNHDKNETIILKNSDIERIEISKK